MNSINKLLVIVLQRAVIGPLVQKQLNAELDLKIYPQTIISLPWIWLLYYDRSWTYDTVIHLMH